MLEQEVTIRNRSGLHTRPAAALVKLAAKFKSEVFLVRDGWKINAKSIIGVMTLAAEQGSKLTLEVDGKDEKKAIKELKVFFDDGFGET
jgi:phosphocarrier protein HPr